MVKGPGGGGGEGRGDIGVRFDTSTFNMVRPFNKLRDHAQRAGS